MSEHPSGWNAEHIEQVNQRIDQIIENMSEPAQYGSVIVTIDEPSWATADVWFLAQCQMHEDGRMVMRCSTERQRAYLATTVRRYLCPKGSHKEVSNERQER